MSNKRDNMTGKWKEKGHNDNTIIEQSPSLRIKQRTAMDVDWLNKMKINKTDAFSSPRSDDEN